MAEVIPIRKRPAPVAFTKQVADPGKAWLTAQGIAPPSPDARLQVPDKFKWNTLWRKCIPDLHAAYGGICAFSGVYMELVVGARTVEHFRPKNLYPGLAYDWDNYRLVCSTLNGRKSDFEDVLDPFLLKPGRFHLDFTLGSIAPNSRLPVRERAAVQATIDRLKLDDADCRKLRLRYFNEFIENHIDEDYLRRHSPFVWTEMKRQELL